MDSSTVGKGPGLIFGREAGGADGGGNGGRGGHVVEVKWAKLRVSLAPERRGAFLLGFFGREEGN